MPVNYLSPSSLMQFQFCPEKFRLLRVEKKPSKRESTLSMDSGTAFDAFVKCELNKMLVIENELAMLKIPEAKQVGKKLYNAYKKCGALQALINEGIVSVCIDKLVEVNGVPFRGKPDLVLRSGIVSDWKVSGVERDQSPKKGYRSRTIYNLSTENWVEKGAHSKEFPLNEIDQRWATQTLCGQFMNGRRPSPNIVCGIEQLSLRGVNLSICSYRSFVDIDFQKLIWNSIKEAWGVIQSNSWPEPFYEKRKCLAYNRECEVAEFCSGWKQKDEEFSWKSPSFPTSL